MFIRNLQKGLCFLLLILSSQDLFSIPIIYTVAGTGILGFVGDGENALGAYLALPTGVAIDVFGNVYIADTNNNRIRKVDPTGIITTFAGNGTATYNGDGIPATVAALNAPIGVSVDLSGNVYIVDTNNNRIRKVNTSGFITTFAGTGTAGYNGDGIPATAAELNTPTNVAIDLSGNVYIADVLNNRIRKVDSAGIITTFAGTGTYGYNGDGIPALTAELNFPAAVETDLFGNVYIADEGNNRIRLVNPSGVITTFAGTGIAGYNGDNIPALSADLNLPTSLAIDPSGNVYIADEGNNRIRKVNSSGMITTFAGNGIAGYNGDGIAAKAAELYSPTDVAIDRLGNVYIADTKNQRIREVVVSQTVIADPIDPIKPRKHAKKCHKHPHCRQLLKTRLTMHKEKRHSLQKLISKMARGLPEMTRSKIAIPFEVKGHFERLATKQAGFTRALSHPDT